MNQKIIAPQALHLTIGTYPSNSLVLDQELKLLKAALLYGDQVELYSLKASLIAMFMKPGNISGPLDSLVFLSIYISAIIIITKNNCRGMRLLFFLARRKS
jgi:hypothetical protein